MDSAESIKKRKYVNILGIEVPTWLTINSVIEEAVNAINESKKITIASVNPELLVTARDNKSLHSFLKGSDIRLPDGIGVVMASKMLGNPIRERVAGIEVMEALIRSAAKNKQKVFFFGAQPGVATLAAKKLVERYPGFIYDTYAGFENGEPIENYDVVIDRINEYSPDYLFVALGGGKQEQFIVDNIDKLNTRIFMPVGGSFDIFSENSKRAPRVLRSHGFEWLYRLYKQPTRIGRQASLVKFIVIVINERYGKR